jgi:hypothetical protein
MLVIEVAHSLNNAAKNAKPQVFRKMCDSSDFLNQILACFYSFLSPTTGAFGSYRR